MSSVGAEMNSHNLFFSNFGIIFNLVNVDFGHFTSWASHVKPLPNNNTQVLKMLLMNMRLKI